eukprot:gene9380-19466_t
MNSTQSNYCMEDILDHFHVILNFGIISNTASNIRLDRVARGHVLWNVISDSVEANQNGTHITEASKSKSSDEEDKNINEIKSKNQNIIKGVTVDLKGKGRMHYGMTIVLINFLEQILCINEYDEVQCKPVSLLEKEDKICFKLLDLSEPLNPGPIQYGAPLWLQVVDPSGSGDNNWQNGSVIGVKLFGPPEMKSMRIGELMNVKEHSSHDSIHRHNNNNNSNNSNSNNSSPLGKLSLPMDSSASSPSLNNSSNAMTKSFLTADTNDGGSPQGDKTLLNRKNKSTTTTSTSLSSAALSKQPRKKAMELAQICGGVNTAKVAAGKHESIENRFVKSKQSLQLGQFVAHCALRSPDGDDPEYLNSQVPVIMEQDLYCLATSHGSGYRPWPRKARDFERNMNNSNNLTDQSLSTPAVKSKQTSISGNRDRQSMSSLDSMSVAANPGGGGGGVSGEDSALANGSDYACLRQVVMRGLPYEHIVDRRCVWRFCVVDSAGDFKSMSVKEQRAQKLLKKVCNVTLEGHSLVGGESFPSMIREEENIAAHFVELLKEHKEFLHGYLDTMSDGEGTMSVSSRAVDIPLPLPNISLGTSKSGISLAGSSASSPSIVGGSSSLDILTANTTRHSIFSKRDSQSESGKSAPSPHSHTESPHGHAYSTLRGRSHLLHSFSSGNHHHSSGSGTGRGVGGHGHHGSGQSHRNRGARASISQDELFLNQ